MAYLYLALAAFVLLIYVYVVIRDHYEQKEWRRQFSTNATRTRLYRMCGFTYNNGHWVK